MNQTGPKTNTEAHPAAPHIRVQDEHERVINVIQLAPDGVTIGRALHSTLALPSGDVSLLHARVDWDSITGRVTLTDLGSASGTYVDGRRLTANMPVAWNSTQLVQIGGYRIKLVLPTAAHPSPMTSPTNSPATPSSPPPAHPGSRRPHSQRRPIIALAGVTCALALGLLAYGLLARPAEIARMVITTAEGRAAVEFKVNHAQRVELRVNGRPADAARFAFTPGTGEGRYIADVRDTDFELIAFNSLGWPTSGRLMIPPPAPTPTERPTATPQPDDIGFAVYAFNGVNKTGDLSDIVLNKGEPLDIEWDVVNAESVELHPAGTFKPKDAVRVAPIETTVYTLIARNRAGEARRSVKVVVVDMAATAAAQAAASVAAQSTRDAEALAQAQAAATATTASQATATAIAQSLTEAQAAAAAKATRDALAIIHATVTAAARETAQANSTVVAQATSSAEASLRATVTASARSTAQALEARYGQYSGIWTNNDPDTDGITRLVITNAGPTITVQAFSRCRPQECDWGSRSRGFTGEPFTITFEFGDGVTRRLTLMREGATLRVSDADSRGPIRTYVFSPGG